MTDFALHAQALHGVLETINNVMFFDQSPSDEFAALGIDPRTQGYVAGRAAPLGAAGPELVLATFFNFSELMVRMFVPSVWEVVTPQQMLDARARGAQGTFERIGAPTEHLDEMASLLDEAIAAAEFAGRPLGAANAGVAMPDAPFAALWQRVCTLREHRGDGHISLLTSAGLTPTEASVLYVAWTDQVSRRFTQGSRVRTDEEWSEAEAMLARRGWLDAEGVITPEGKQWRDEIETATDLLASGPYRALGEEKTRRLFDLLHEIASAVGEGGVYKRPPALPEPVPVGS